VKDGAVCSPLYVFRVEEVRPWAQEDDRGNCYFLSIAQLGAVRTLGCGTSRACSVSAWELWMRRLFRRRRGGDSEGGHTLSAWKCDKQRSD